MTDLLSYCYYLMCPQLNEKTNTKTGGFKNTNVTTALSTVIKIINRPMLKLKKKKNLKKNVRHWDKYFHHKNKKMAFKLAYNFSLTPVSENKNYKYSSNLS